MKSTSNSLRYAVHCVLLASAAAALPALPALAQETDSAARPMEEVVITGSRIRRVDEETASPVFVMDQNTIANTGVQTMGDLMMRVPAISGAATNPQVNNGGGTGESNVELRGLGAQRTLVLLNGRRINVLGANGTTSAVDINMIPINMIERVEVLKEGAGAVYGSDAIAGVVNFITKKNFDGADSQRRIRPDRRERRRAPVRQPHARHERRQAERHVRRELQQAGVRCPRPIASSPPLRCTCTVAG